jgi:hypothetical protein
MEGKQNVVRQLNDSIEANKALKAQQTTSRYQVRLRGRWTEVKFGVRIMEVFLQYELEDGTTGTARPSDWRLNRTRFEETKRRNKALGSRSTASTAPKNHP